MSEYHKHSHVFLGSGCLTFAGRLRIAAGALPQLQCLRLNQNLQAMSGKTSSQKRLLNFSLSVQTLAETIRCPPWSTF